MVPLFGLNSVKTTNSTSNKWQVDKEENINSTCKKWQVDEKADNISVISISSASDSPCVITPTRRKSPLFRDNKKLYMSSSYHQIDLTDSNKEDYDIKGLEEYTKKVTANHNGYIVSSTPISNKIIESRTPTSKKIPITPSQKVVADYNEMIETIKTKITQLSPYDEKRRQKSKQQSLEIERLKQDFLFPKLSESVNEQIDDALRASDDKLLVTAFNIDICGRDVKTLKPCTWLNDNIMNVYVQLVLKRSKNNPELGPIHCFNTFFYENLEEKGYDSVRRWTKRAKVDIFSLSRLIIPVHLPNHWCLAVINFEAKRFEYYDSLRGSNQKCFELLREYLTAEHKDKKNQEYSLQDWTDYSPKDIPCQMNGYDCGVFASQYANYAAIGLPFNFSQNQMSLFRRRMIYEIMTSELFPIK